MNKKIELNGKRFCPYCEREQEGIVKTEVIKDTIKGQELEYQVEFYVCEVCKQEFQDGEQLDETLERIKSKLEEE